jgi:hypothetical protein
VAAVYQELGGEEKFRPIAEEQEIADSIVNAGGPAGAFG